MDVDVRRAGMLCSPIRTKPNSPQINISLAQRQQGLEEEHRVEGHPAPITMYIKMPMVGAEVMWHLRELTDTTAQRVHCRDISLLTHGRIDISAVSSHRQLTDVYLMALPVAPGTQFVTPDRSVELTAGSGASEEHLAMI